MLDLLPHRCSVKQEIAAVPEIMVGNVFRSRLCVGLFDERLDLVHEGAIELLSRTNIAVVGRGIGGVDAEGDDPALRGGEGSAPTRIAELVELTNEVIGGEHKHERFG